MTREATTEKIKKIVIKKIALVVAIVRRKIAIEAGNEIEAVISGVVVEMLVANGEPVEYNQPLVKLRPA